MKSRLFVLLTLTALALGAFALQLSGDGIRAPRTARAAPENLTYYLHGNDAPGIGDGYVMDGNQPPPQQLQVSLLGGPHWTSAPTLSGTFGPGASFVVVKPCLVGLELATTYRLALTDAAGNEVRPLGQTTRVLGLCFGQEQITIPVSTPFDTEGGRLKLSIGSVLGLNVNLSLGSATYLRATNFETPTPTPTATATSTPTSTATMTPTVTPTQSITITPTVTPPPSTTGTPPPTPPPSTTITPTLTPPPGNFPAIEASAPTIGGQPAGIPPGPTVSTSGSPLTIQVSVENTGPSELSDIAGTSSIGNATCAVLVLSPGESTICSFTAPNPVPGQQQVSLSISATSLSSTGTGDVVVTDTQVAYYVGFFLPPG